MHKDGFEVSDITLFEEDCKNIIHYLSITEFNKTFSSNEFTPNAPPYKKNI